MTDPNLYFTMAGAEPGRTRHGLPGRAGRLARLAEPQGTRAATFADHGHTDGPSLPNASARIEIADLKERIRKLEAIASGVDL